MSQPNVGAALAESEAKLAQFAARQRELEAQIAKLEAERAEAAARRNTLTCKVSDKGGISVYGINTRMPVTLYVNQWERLIAFIPTLVAFAKAHDSELSRKPVK